MTRSELIQKIAETRAEAEKSGFIHRRDLYKHIHRMEKELLIYDKYQREARRKRITA